jgi:riboflavin synthase
LMIIPHTFENTIFKYYKIGQKVNIEVDYITKHLEKLKND